MVLKNRTWKDNKCNRFTNKLYSNTNYLKMCTSLHDENQRNPQIDVEKSGRQLKILPN